MVRDAERRLVKVQGVSVEYTPSQHVTEQEAYRLADAVRHLMLREGLLVRGDFTIRSEKPR
jgi:hypothetical protein